jgi:hypothetical protein
MFIMISFQIITGSSVNLQWQIVSGVTVVATVCGDSIILLFYDVRWKASINEMKSKLRQIICHR